MQSEATLPEFRRPFRRGINGNLIGEALVPPLYQIKNRGGTTNVLATRAFDEFFIDGHVQINTPVLLLLPDRRWNSGESE